MKTQRLGVCDENLWSESDWPLAAIQWGCAVTHCASCDVARTPLVTTAMPPAVAAGSGRVTGYSDTQTSVLLALSLATGL